MKVLVIGGTGMLGRPVVRRLMGDEFDLRVLVRDEQRARAILPAGCELVRGDLRDIASLDRALAGVDAVYTSLATLFDRRAPYDPDRDGTPAILAAAQRAGVDRVLRISAMGVPEAAGEWWAIARKAETDDFVLRSGLRATVFRPTWFMESLALFAIGRCILGFGAPRAGLWWIAGDDYARIVSAAIRSDDAANRAYVVQGPESVSLRDAVQRFARACRPRLRTVPAPRLALRAAGLVLSQPRYLDDLFDMTWKWTTDFQGEGARALAPPTMTIESYAASIRATGDWPRK